MDDDEFAELYGTSAVDEPVHRPAPAAVNGAVAAHHHIVQPAAGKDDFEDLYGQSLGEDTPTAYPAAPQPAYAATGLSATPFGAQSAMPNSYHAKQPMQHLQQHAMPAAAAPKAAAAAADEDDEDFDILVDDDNGPMPAPQPAAATPAAASYPKPPGAAAGAANAALTASGRLSSTHLQYVRPGLEGQGSMGHAGLAQQHGQQHYPHMMAPGQGSGGPEGAQRQGSALSGYGSAQLGPPGAQQYSLPLPGVGMGQQLPGPPAVPGPRPPAAPYPGPPVDAGAGGMAGPRPPLGAPPELNFIPMGQAGFQIAAQWRDMDAAFPSAAGPQQPIKLPRQHNVDKEEYKEFLNLGHGEIFNLDLDRVTTAPWCAAGADISDFFNYGLTEKSWRQYMRQVAKYRAAYTINNKIEILSSDRHDDELEGLPREIASAVRTWRQQHPNKDKPSNNSNNPQQFLPRTRGREYKRTADTSVVLTLVTAEEGLQPEVPTSKRDKRTIGGEYDGPSAGDIAVSGIPDLPPHTVGPPSPRAEPEPAAGKRQFAGDHGDHARQLPSAGSGMMQQHQAGNFQQQQQQQLMHQRSSGSVGVERLEGMGADDVMQQMPGAAAAGMAAAAAGDLHPGVMRPGRGVQVKLAARTPLEEQQQQQQQEEPPQFLDESEMMAEYYNEQLQRQASAGVQPGPDEDQLDFDGDDAFEQHGMPGMRKRGRDDGMMQHHMADLDEFDDSFTGMGHQQQQHMGSFMGPMGQNPSAMMGMGGFGGGMGMGNPNMMGMNMAHAGMPGGGMMPGPGRRMMGSEGAAGMMGSAAVDDDLAAAVEGSWEGEPDDGMPQQQQQQPQQGPGWDAEGMDAEPQQQQQVFDDGFDGQGGFMGADMYEGDGFDSGWGPGTGSGGPLMGPGGEGSVGPDGWGAGMAGAGVPANACFNCGATDHMARNCPHPKHFNITCHNCGELGHRAKDCKAPRKPPPGSDQRCFKCGQEGHIARECPNPPRMGPGPGPERPWGPGPPPPHFGGPPQPPPPPRPAGDKPPAAAAAAGGHKPDGEHFDDAAFAARRAAQTCFKCGQEGHIARECPNPPGSPKPEREGPQPPTCFKCGGEGHYARECTAPRSDRWDGGATLDRGGPPHRPGPGACYNCGKEGHIARECPNPPRGAPPPPRGPPPLPPPRSVFDRLGGPAGRGPGPWDGPPPGRIETPEERAAREAEIDRRLRLLEGVDGRPRADRDRDSHRDREAREPSPPRGAGSGSGRALSARERDREKEKERERDKERQRPPVIDKEAVKRSSRSAAADEGPRSSKGREEEERRSSRRASSRDRKRSRSPERRREKEHKKDKHSSKRDHSRSVSRSPSRDKSRKSSKHSSRHRSRSGSRSRSRSRGRHRR